jgi:hypothetical protein
MSKVADSLSYKAGCKDDNPSSQKCTSEVGNICKLNVGARLPNHWRNRNAIEGSVCVAELHATVSVI